mmetsp:Transcript_6556/g.14966  ORF Transcript_6556/g.14966 Transcript_6556/m.14966 type:complete len:209 (-) Transcript_6556:292-918(-)
MRQRGGSCGEILQRACCAAVSRRHLLGLLSCSPGSSQQLQPPLQRRDFVLLSCQTCCQCSLEHERSPAFADFSLPPRCRSSWSRSPAGPSAPRFPISGFWRRRMCGGEETGHLLFGCLQPPLCLLDKVFLHHLLGLNRVQPVPRSLRLLLYSLQDFARVCFHGSLHCLPWYKLVPNPVGCEMSWQLGRLWEAVVQLDRLGSTQIRILS